MKQPTIVRSTVEPAPRIPLTRLYRCSKHNTLCIGDRICSCCAEEIEFAKRKAAGLPTDSLRESIGPERGEHWEDTDGRTIRQD